MPRILPSALALTALLTWFLPVRGFGAAAGTDDYNITIRTAVDRDYKIFGKTSDKTHGKAYAIIQFQQAKNDTPLAKPVNQLKVYRELQTGLSAYGFHAPAAGQNPDIVLTVIFGRGWLQNPIST
jgi:hypothetical protein